MRMGLLTFSIVLFTAALVSAKPLTIVAFGDSTTAPRKGVEQVYAQRLPNLLKAKGIEAAVINAGVGGSHSGLLSDNARHRREHARDRFDQAVRAKHPDTVIIQFGLNDSWVDSGETDGASRIPVAAYRKNIEYVIKTLQDDGADVVLMTPNNIGAKFEKWRYQRAASYAAEVRKLAGNYDLPLVDVWKMFETYGAQPGQSADDLMLDGMHPNDRGHAMIAEQLAIAIASGQHPVVVKDDLDVFTIPAIDLNDEADMHVVVDREKGQYLGHPTTVLLEDGKTILTVFPKGHGRGGIVYKRSDDGGKTWSERLPTPDNWSTSREVPTIHRVVDAAGKKRLIMWSGLYPARLAVSEDDGKTWGPLEKVGDWGGIVVMGFVEPLKTGKGHYLAMFHDDGRFFTKDAKRTGAMTLYTTKSTDGGLTWSQPDAIYQSDQVHLCEPGVIRSPDGKQLAVLLRENRRVKNSHIIFSNDEGKTWTDPRPLPLSLTGDRHTGKYAPDGRLVISFRSILPADKRGRRPFEGDWAGWVGTYDDLVEGTEGQYFLRFKDNTKGYDTTYPGVEVLGDGTFVITTYGHWDEGESPYIRAIRFKLEQIDAKAEQQAEEK